MRIEYHRTLIADTARNDAFYAALQAVIVPGKTVVADIGAGTGLLGLICVKARSEGCLSVRDSRSCRRRRQNSEEPTVSRIVISSRVIRRNSIDRLQVDVIVSETLGNYALEENIIETLNDARRRFLKPGGIVIPSAITQYVVPVIASAHR